MSNTTTPLRHAAYLMEQIHDCRSDLDHEDHAARLAGLLAILDAVHQRFHAEEKNPTPATGTTTHWFYTLLRRRTS